MLTARTTDCGIDTGDDIQWSEPSVGSQAYRRIVVRYENHINMFIAFFQLACVMVTLRKCL